MRPPALLHIRGIPKPQPRPRFVRGRVISTADPKTRAWKDQVLRAAHAAARQGGRFDGPVSVSVNLYLPTRDASRWGKPHALKPDRDNLDKALLDAITAGGLWADDCQAAAGSFLKSWCRPGDEGAVVLVEGLQTGGAPPWAGSPAPDWLAGVSQG